MATNAKIKKAVELLEQRANALKLIDRHGAKRGDVVSIQVTDYITTPALMLESGLYTLETLEKWIKQAKSAQKKGYL